VTGLKLKKNQKL